MVGSLPRAARSLTTIYYGLWDSGLRLQHQRGSSTSAADPSPPRFPAPVPAAHPTQLAPDADAATIFSAAAVSAPRNQIEKENGLRSISSQIREGGPHGDISRRVAIPTRDP